VVAINISAQDVMNPEQLTMINNLLDTNGLPAEALSFELTEGDLIKDPEQALQHLGYLRSSGFSIAIDDFGTGYSSLAYLTQLPINVLKIDKSFVLNLDTSKDDQTIVQTVIKLAHSFGMEVVAEGVENAESLALLKKWGCEWAQGYYICRPIAAPDLIEWYKERESKLAS
jgi:EAL domain-containing protein (putative c-di-GMP-specific phosphodiesterase class I)